MWKRSFDLRRKITILIIRWFLMRFVISEKFSLRLQNYLNYFENVRYRWGISGSHRKYPSDLRNFIVRWLSEAVRSIRIVIICNRLFCFVCFTLLNILANHFIMQLCVHVINLVDHSYFSRVIFIILAFFYLITSRVWGNLNLS